ncbi:hypothetical protein PG993_013852 [Apiospora rasikravindrae]|uniref:Extracellular membrane protein CFEM domain-containing protein n=1 Tax=Apiospora rasikravindrae TaxID=990691 RepID=A0ABR1RSI5_9PEZI
MRALSSTTSSTSSGRPSAIQTLTVLTWLIGHFAAPAAALANDFSSYPSGSQDCLSRAADSSKCSGSTGKDLNECLCTNKGNFVYNTASCVAKDSPSDLDAVYATLQSNCAGTGVTLTVSKDAFMAKAAAATAATTTAKPSKTKSDGSTPTTSSDPDPASSPTDSSTADKGSWSSTAKVGVGVGIGVGASVLILVGALLWRRYRRGQQWKQQQGGNGDPGMAVMGGGREYHQPPGNPHAPSSYMGSTYGGDGSVAGTIPMQHTGGSGSQMTGSWHKSPTSPGGSTGYWNANDASNRNSLAPPPHHHAQQGQPLLAELGGESHAYQQPSAPVELPAQEQSHQKHQSSPPLQPSPPVQTPYQQHPFSPHDFGRTNNY